MDYRKTNNDIQKKYFSSVAKARKKGVILNWSNPQRHVDDETLRFIFYKLGVPISITSCITPLTIEEFAYILDYLHLLDE